MLQTYAFGPDGHEVADHLLGGTYDINYVYYKGHADDQTTKNKSVRNVTALMGTPYRDFMESDTEINSIFIHGSMTKLLGSFIEGIRYTGKEYIVVGVMNLVDDRWLTTWTYSGNTEESLSKEFDTKSEMFTFIDEAVAEIATRKEEY